MTHDEPYVMTSQSSRDDARIDPIKRIEKMEHEYNSLCNQKRACELRLAALNSEQDDALRDVLRANLPTSESMLRSMNVKRTFKKRRLDAHEEVQKIEERLLQLRESLKHAKANRHKHDGVLETLIRIESVLNKILAIANKERV